MLKSAVITGMGMYVPEQVVTNDDLATVMDTSDEWIQERTGIKERRYGKRNEESPVSFAKHASEQAIAEAGIDKNEIDFIIFATLSSDYFFPGCGVLLQRELGITNTEIGALDVRNQCSGFVYALSVADQFIKTGMYKKILVVGSEMHSMGLDFSTRGRGVTVIFGDGAGAAIVEPTEDEGRGILSTHLHSNGEGAEQLCMINPGAHGGRYDDVDYGYPETRFGSTFITQKMLDNGLNYPYMNGQAVFKMAVRKFPEVIGEALAQNELSTSDIDIFVPHQANLRISQFVQKVLKLNDDQVVNNIQKYGNTTAASIPIALCEAWKDGRINKGDLVCLAAFGSGFTWASALIRW